MLEGSENWTGEEIKGEAKLQSREDESLVNEDIRVRAPAPEVHTASLKPVGEFQGSSLETLVQAMPVLVTIIPR